MSFAEDPEERAWRRRRQFSSRLNLLFFIVFALFATLVSRLAILTFVDGPTLQARQFHTLKKDVTISPIRGNIFDRNGAWIAATASTQTLFYTIEPKQKPEAYIRVARQLEEAFAKYGKSDLMLPAAEILERMDVGCDLTGKPAKRKPGYLYMPRRIKSGLTQAEIAFLAEHRDELAGISISEESTRVYNPDQIAVQTVGYMRPFSTARTQLEAYRQGDASYRNDEYVGMDGVELSLQDELRGRVGRKWVPVNARNEIIGELESEAPEKGHTLFLTIDKDVQLAAQRAITDHLKLLHESQDEHYSDGKRAVAGYAVAMEVNSGRIVAMASMPDYDPNVWIGGLPQKEYDRIQYRYTNGAIRDRKPEYPGDKAGHHPSSMVPPGSTLKPLSVLVGLNEGLFAPGTRYEDEGFFFYGKDNNSKVSNAGGTAWGPINAVQALAHSSNTFMASMIGDRLYKSKTNALELWHSYMTKFGLGIPTGSGLPFENDGQAGYFNTKGSSAQAQLVFASYGQAAKYTTLQLAVYASMLANHGKRYKPQLVDKIVTYEGDRVVSSPPPQLLEEVNFPPSYWATVEKGMRSVSAVGFDGPFGERVARKTGTSESEVTGGKVDNAVFIAYAPVDKPKLAVAVVVPEGGYGKYGAAPIARKIFDAYDQYVGLDTP